MKAYVVVRDGCTCCEGGKTILYIARTKENAEQKISALEEIAKRAEAAYEDYRQQWGTISAEINNKLPDPPNRPAEYTGETKEIDGKRYYVTNPDYLEWLRTEWGPNREEREKQLQTARNELDARIAAKYDVPSEEIKHDTRDFVIEEIECDDVLITGVSLNVSLSNRA